MSQDTNDVSAIVRKRSREASLHENGHQFERGEALGFGPHSVLYVTYICRHCGIVRNDEGNNKPCRGAVRVTARAEGNRAPIDGNRKEGN